MKSRISARLASNLSLILSQNPLPLWGEEEPFATQERYGTGEGYNPFYDSKKPPLSSISKTGLTALVRGEGKDVGAIFDLDGFHSEMQARSMTMRLTTPPVCFAAKRAIGNAAPRFAADVNPKYSMRVFFDGERLSRNDRRYLGAIPQHDRHPILETLADFLQGAMDNGLIVSKGQFTPQEEATFYDQNIEYTAAKVRRRFSKINIAGQDCLLIESPGIGPNRKPLPGTTVYTLNPCKLDANDQFIEKIGAGHLELHLCRRTDSYIVMLIPEFKGDWSNYGAFTTTNPDTIAQFTSWIQTLEYQGVTS